MSFAIEIRNSKKLDELLKYISKNFEIHNMFTEEQMINSINECGFKPEEVFSEAQLESWALKNGFITQAIEVEE